jgi:hypothetical protein
MSARKLVANSKLLQMIPKNGMQAGGRGGGAGQTAEDIPDLKADNDSGDRS